MTETIRAITFDFGNTLVPFHAASMAVVVREEALLAARLVGCSIEDFEAAWADERRRQFAEDVPEGREADMDVRLVRVLARLRGHPVPPIGTRWDDVALSSWTDADEVEAILRTYADAFVRNTPVPSEVAPMLQRLAASYPLAIISNWPLSLSLDRFIEAAGWSRYFRAVVISHRVGAIKPSAEIFETAARELGVPSGPSILHVGDDMGADVFGAHNVGWSAAWVRHKPEDLPLPVAPPAPDEQPDLVIDSVLDLEAALRLAGHSMAK